MELALRSILPVEAFIQPRKQIFFVRHFHFWWSDLTGYTNPGEYYPVSKTTLARSRSSDQFGALNKMSLTLTRRESQNP